MVSSCVATINVAACERGLPWLLQTVKMVLKRNGLGQLGFHIQSEGIVTDVEPYGFAWEVGLRKGSRLVEICKVATITLTHDQIVDLLRTSAVVKVVVVPPLEDGTPRYEKFFTSSLFKFSYVCDYLQLSFSLFSSPFCLFCCVCPVVSCLVVSDAEQQTGRKMERKLLILLQSCTILRVPQ